MRRIRLLHLNLGVYAALAALLGLYGGEVRWAADALPKQWAGEFPGLAERRLQREATALLRDAGDVARARELLAQSIAIDPNSSARFFAAEVLYRGGGDLEAALAAYESYLAIDPLHLESHLRRAEILAALGRTDARRRALAEGLADFEAEAALQTPRLVPEVAARFNRKAIAVHGAQRAAIRRLRDESRAAQGAAARP